MISRLLNDPLSFLLTLPCILLALSGHEFAHGWAAWKLTTYGTQFATLARMVGKGGMYIR